MLSPARCGAALIAALMMAGTAHAASVGVCGGSGGSQSKTLSCPAGHYVVGLFVRVGSYLDRVGIRCARIDSAGKRGKLGAFQYAGGTGGSESQSATCPGDRAVVDIGFKAGTYIDRLPSGVCEPREANAGFRSPTFETMIRFNAGPGFSGGNNCALRCPQGEAIHRLIVRYGSWIDSIEGFCRP
jgi:hypothetical protein